MFPSLSIIIFVLACILAQILHMNNMHFTIWGFFFFHDPPFPFCFMPMSLQDHEGQGPSFHMSEYIS